MSDTIEIRVPDIGDFKDIPVIEVLVKPGDTIAKETPLVVLESDKASMEVPSSAAGVVQDVKLKVGDKVSQGSVILSVASSEPVILSVAPAGAESKDAAPQALVDVTVPDIGDFKDVPVIEILVKPGDAIAKEAPLVVLESDKASMEVPASVSGIVKDVKVKVGDKVSQGTVILSVAPSGAESKGSAPVAAPAQAAPTQAEPPTVLRQAQDDTGVASAPPSANATMVHASPSIRRFARELGVDIHGLKGSGPNGRITREDVQHFVKGALARGAAPGATASPFGVPPWPKVAYEQYG